MKKLTPELQVATFGVASVVFLEAYALYQGVDGVMFGAAMAGLGAIIGWVFKGMK